MTISPVSQTTQINSAQNAKVAAPPPKPPAPKPDSVQLSSAAKQQLGDADHDGDGH